MWVNLYPVLVYVSSSPQPLFFPSNQLATPVMLMFFSTAFWDFWKKWYPNHYVVIHLTASTMLIWKHVEQNHKIRTWGLDNDVCAALFPSWFFHSFWWVSIQTITQIIYFSDHIILQKFFISPPPTPISALISVIIFREKQRGKPLTLPIQRQFKPIFLFVLGVQQKWTQ